MHLVVPTVLLLQGLSASPLWLLWYLFWKFLRESHNRFSGRTSGCCSVLLTLKGWFLPLPTPQWSCLPLAFAAAMDVSMTSARHLPSHTRTPCFHTRWVLSGGILVPLEPSVFQVTLFYLWHLCVEAAVSFTNEWKVSSRPCPCSPHPHPLQSTPPAIYAHIF